MSREFDGGGEMARAVTIVGLGESLFDVFPDRAILGGAPLNVAFHAHQLATSYGGRGIVASRAGVDELGLRMRRELAEQGLSTEFVQDDLRHPTGRVDITLRDGEPQYTFLDNVAWDHLEWTPAWERLATTCDAVVFGTLGQRISVARATVRRFVETARQALRLFDVNLRVNFFDADSLRHGVAQATAVKLNDRELPIVLQHLGCPPGRSVDWLLSEFGATGLRYVVVTHGENGTELYAGRDGFPADGVRGPVVRFESHPQADNVGAGDACSAGLLWSWLNDWSPEQTVAFANRLGAFVASQPGATPRLPLEVRQSR